MNGKVETATCAKCGASFASAREGEPTSCAQCGALAEETPNVASHVGSWAAFAVIGVAMLLIGVVEWWFQRP